MATFYIKETDSEIVLKVNADLTGSTVRVVHRRVGTTETSDLPAVITDYPKGHVTVDTSLVTVGKYDIEIKQFRAGKKFHYPNKGYDTLIVEADLGE